jgi:hypothetical protein
MKKSGCFYYQKYRKVPYVLSIVCLSLDVVIGLVLSISLDHPCILARLYFSRVQKIVIVQPYEQLTSNVLTFNVLLVMSFSRLSRMFNRARMYAPDARDASFYLFGFATWIPAFIFVNSHVAELSWIKGPSMYPYLNTDYNRTTKQDMCINWKWAPLKGLQRGMIVTFW